MNNDIRLDIGFWEHPKTIKLIRRLGLEGPVALQKLWLWATQNRPDGVLSGMDDEDIEIVAKWSGEGTALYDALTALRFIDVVDGTHMLHNWKKRNTWQAEAEARSEKARSASRSKWGDTNRVDNVATRSQRLSEARRKCSHTEGEWLDMVGFFGGICVRCGKYADKLVKDHIIPIYQGGCDGIRNLQPLCTSCNSSKGPENKDHRGEYADRLNKEMPAEWLQNTCKTQDNACPNACERLKTPQNAYLNACPSPLLSSPNQEEKKKNKNPPISPLGDGEGEIQPPDLAADSEGLPILTETLLTQIQAAYEETLPPVGWNHFGGWYPKLTRQIRLCIGEKPSRASPAFWREHFNRIRGSDFPNTSKFSSKSIVWATKPETVGKIENGMWQGSKPEEGTLEGCWEFLNSLNRGKAKDESPEVVDAVYDG